MSLAEPVRKSQLGTAARAGKRLHDTLVIALPDKDIEVFRVPLDSGVPLKRVRTADEIGNTRLVQQGERPAVERTRIHVEHVLIVHCRHHVPPPAPLERSAPEASSGI